MMSSIPYCSSFSGSEFKAEPIDDNFTCDLLKHTKFLPCKAVRNKDGKFGVKEIAENL